MAAAAVSGAAGLFTTLICCTSLTSRRSLEKDGVVLDGSHSLRSMLTRGHRDCVMFVHLTRDKRFLLSVSVDGFVCKWNVATGDCVASFCNPSDRVVAACAVSALDDYLFLGLSDGTVFAPTEWSLSSFWLPTPEQHPSKTAGAGAVAAAKAFSSASSSTGIEMDDAAAARRLARQTRHRLIARARADYVGEYVEVPFALPLGVSAMAYVVLPGRSSDANAMVAAAETRARKLARRARATAARARRAAQAAQAADSARRAVSGRGSAWSARATEGGNSDSALGGARARGAAASSLRASAGAGRAAGNGKVKATTSLDDEDYESDEHSSSLGDSSSSARAPDAQAKATSSAVDSTAVDCVLVGTPDGALVLVDVFNARAVGALKGHEMQVTSVVVSGRTAVSASLDFSLRVWDLAHRTQLYEFTVTRRPVAMTALFRKSAPHAGVAMVLIGSTDGTIEVLSGDGMDKRSLLYGHNPSVRVTALHMDDKDTLISASADSTVKEWDINLRMCRTTYSAHDAGVYSVAFSSDAVFSASGDSTINRYSRKSATRFVLEASSSYGQLPYSALVLPLFDIVTVTLQVLSFPFSRQFPWGSNAQPFQRLVEVGAITFNWRITPRVYFIKYYLTLALMILAVLLNVGNVYGLLIRRFGSLALRWAGANTASVAATKRWYRRASTVTWLTIWLTCTMLLLPIAKTCIEVFKCSSVTTADGDSRVMWDIDPSQRCYRGSHLALAIITVFAGLPYFAFALRLSVCAGDVNSLRASDTMSELERLRRIFFTSWFRSVRFEAFAGLFTRDPFNAQRYYFATALLKISLSAIAIFSEGKLVTASVLYAAFALVSLAVQLTWRPYFFARMNLMFVTCKVVVVYVCVLAVVIVILNDPNSFWAGIAVYVGAFASAFVTILVGHVRNSKKTMAEEVNELERLVRNGLGGDDSNARGATGSV